MVAYSFQAQFIEPTWSGRKIHTIRNERTGRVRHARQGDPITHYTGMRTKHCKLFARSVCSGVAPISITFLGSALDLEAEDMVRLRDGVICRRPFLDKFAQSDGFTSWFALRTFWQKHHPKLFKQENKVFTGVIIYWRDMESVR